MAHDLPRPPRALPHGLRQLQTNSRYHRSSRRILRPRLRQNLYPALLPLHLPHSAYLRRQYHFGPDGLTEARASNLPILSYLANEFDAPFINWLGPIVAIAAIVSSYFGHWLGRHEGAAGIVRKNFDPEKKRISDKALNAAINVFIVVTVWVAAVLNPSVLSLIESLVGPVMALVLFIVPMWTIHKVPALAPYRGKLSNIFVVFSGVAAFSAVVYGLIPS